MKNFLVLCLLACALPAGSMADKPKVSRSIVKSVEESTDQKLQALFSDNPVQVQVLGLTQGAYIDGYGVVFMSELNLAAGTPISPFHPNITADEVKRIHDRKMERLPEVERSDAADANGLGEIHGSGASRRADRARHLVLLLELGEQGRSAGPDSHARSEKAAARCENQRVHEILYPVRRVLKNAAGRNPDRAQAH